MRDYYLENELANYRLSQQNYPNYQYLTDDDIKILYECRWSTAHDTIRGYIVLGHMQHINDLNRDKINSIRKKLEGVSCRK
jgi:hypothetical protein